MNEEHIKVIKIYGTVNCVIDAISQKQITIPKRFG